jgi:hypothetical protein
MAKYTTQLKTIIDSGIDIFARVDYPIFDENYRSVLNQKILDRFLFREIGLETYELFHHFLKRKMNEIMPYYNQLYKQFGILDNPDFNPFFNLNTTVTDSRTVSNEVDSKGYGEGKEIFQDTPSSKLGDADFATNINSSDSVGISSGTSKTTEDYVSKTLGSGGMRYPSDILNEFRSHLINIDVMVIEELNPLFMNIY